MPGALSSIGGALSGGTGGGLMKLLPLILGGAGEIGNIGADRQRAGLMNQEKKWSQLTPEQLSAKIAAATQPLNQGLINSVGNTVQADVGERGLSQAPGIFSGELAQSLAPFQQQNQSTALQAILKQMGLPIEMASLLPGMTNLAPLMALLQNKPSGGTFDPGPMPDITAPLPTDIYGGGTDLSSLYGTPGVQGQ